MSTPADVKNLYLPRGPVCEKMCSGCPFRPDGKGKAVDHLDYPKIVQYVKLGGTFYCHETVLLDKRTTMTGRGMNRRPEPHHQPHFKECRGSVLVKTGEIEPPAGTAGDTQ